MTVVENTVPGKRVGFDAHITRLRADPNVAARNAIISGVSQMPLRTYHGKVFHASLPFSFKMASIFFRSSFEAGPSLITVLPAIVARLQAKKREMPALMQRRTGVARFVLLSTGDEQPEGMGSC